MEEGFGRRAARAGGASRPRAILAALARVVEPSPVPGRANAIRCKPPCCHARAPKLSVRKRPTYVA